MFGREPPHTPIRYMPCREAMEDGLNALTSKFGWWASVGKKDRKRTKPWYWTITPRLVRLGTRSILDRHREAKA